MKSSLQMNRFVIIKKITLIESNSGQSDIFIYICSLAEPDRLDKI